MVNQQHYNELKVINDAIDTGRQRIYNGATGDEAYNSYVAALKLGGVATPQRPEEDHLTMLPQPNNRQGEL